jgi:flagellar biosynthetic protein FlhB
MAEDLGDKTEDPTEQKLRKAREEGNVAKSTEVVAAMDLIAAALLLWFFGSMAIEVGAGLMRTGLSVRSVSGALSESEAPHELLTMLARSGPVLGVALGVLLLTSVVGYLQQVQFLVTTKPLEPKLERLDPFKGFGRIFGLKGLTKGGLNIIKLALVMVTCAVAIAAYLPQFAGLPALELMGAMRLMATLIFKILVWLLVMLALIGAADYAVQRFQHRRDLRMTKQEVKQERKDNDGDPEIKARVAKIGREIAMGKLKREVPRADVVVTNPTHFAVALRYDGGTMAAPVVVAKGADFMAFRIRELAIGAGVPIVEKPELARGLYASTKVGQAVDTRFYQAVAEVLAYVYRLRGERAPAAVTESASASA